MLIQCLFSSTKGKNKTKQNTASFPQLFHLVCHPTTFVGFLFLVIRGSAEIKKISVYKVITRKKFSVYKVVTLIREDKFKDRAHKLGREF